MSIHDVQQRIVTCLLVAEPETKCRSVGVICATSVLWLYVLSSCNICKFLFHHALK